MICNGPFVLLGFFVMNESKLIKYQLLIFPKILMLDLLSLMKSDHLLLLLVVFMGIEFEVKIKLGGGS